jgi:hypothetical protein
LMRLCLKIYLSDDTFDVKDAFRGLALEERARTQKKIGRKKKRTWETASNDVSAPYAKHFTGDIKWGFSLTTARPREMEMISAVHIEDAQLPSAQAAKASSTTIATAADAI